MAREVKVNVVGDSRSARKALEKLDKRTSTTGEKLKKLGKMAGKAAKVVAAGVVAAGAAAVASSFKIASFGDEIAKTSTKLGVTTDALQEMRVWADRNGLSSESLDRALGRLNQRIGRAVDGNEKYADAFEAVGVSIQDAEGNVRSTNDVMGETIKALSDIEDPAMQSARASEIFGTKMARDLMPALQDGSLSMEDAAELAHELGVVMDEDALAAAERFEDGWANLKESAMGFLRQAGIPVMEFMADKLFPAIQDKVIPAVQRFGKAIKGLFDLIVRGDFTSGLSEALGVSEDSPLVGGLLNLRETAIAVFDRVVAAMHQVADWWEANGPKIIARVREFGERASDVFQTVSEWVTDTLIPAIQKIVDWWKSNWPTIRKKLADFYNRAEELFNDVAEFAEDFKKAIEDVFETVTGWFSTAADDADESESSMSKTWKQLLKTATTVWNAVIDVISTVLGLIAETVATVTATVQYIWERWGEDIKDFAGRTWDNIMGVIDGALQIIQGIFDVFAGLFTLDWERTWEGVKSIVSGVWTIIESAWDQFLNTIKLYFTVWWDIFSGVWSSVWTAVKDFVSDRVDDVVTFVRELPGRAKDALAGAWEAWNTFWEKVFTEIKEFVSDRVTDVVGFFEELPGRLIEGMANIGSKVAGFVGREFELVKARIAGAINDIVQWFRDLPGRIVSALGNIGSKIASTFSFSLSGSGQGDGPGAKGGKALSKVQSVLSGFPSASITNTYRSPAHNARVGGSPDSYHMDEDDPAVDIVAPRASILDSIHARLQAVGGWRELLWRVPNHAPGDNMHIHVAHDGGLVEPSWPTLPGLRGDERPAVLQVGEEVVSKRDRKRGRGGTTIINNNYGNDPAEVDRRTRRALRQVATDWGAE